MTCERLLFSGALLVMLRVPAGAQDKPPSPEALAAAEAAVVAARSEKDLAAAGLEALVYDLADDYAALTSDADAPARRQALVLAMHDALPSASARLATELAKGRPILRGTRRQILQEAFTDPVAAATPVDPRFASFLLRRVAEALAGHERFDDITSEQILQAIDATLPAGRNWYEFWNQVFHEGLPEAERLKVALTAYEAAGVKLDRLQHPERYGTHGEASPPGMVIVPGGNYELGPNAGWQRSVRHVRLDAFAIDRHEVTEAEYALFLNAQPVDKRGPLAPRGWLSSDAGEYTAAPDERDLPVCYVNWAQAAAYAAWAGKRLPTEDEWEAAAGGVDGRAYPWGNEFHSGLCNGGEAATRPLPVESFPQAPAACGALDMAGNVWEWTATLEDGTNLDRAPEGLVNVAIRGGAFDSRREELATRYRWTAPGNDAFASPRYTRPIGFRCAKDL